MWCVQKPLAHAVAPGVPQGASAPITTEPAGGDPIVDNGPCTDDLECPFGERCIDGVCLEDPGAQDLSGCTDDSDCPDGMVCSEETGACVDPAENPDVTVEEEGDSSRLSAVSAAAMPAAARASV